MNGLNRCLGFLRVLPSAFKSSAFSTTAPCSSVWKFSDNGVLKIVCVSLWALGNVFATDNSPASRAILASCHQSEMLRIDATRISANVIHSNFVVGPFFTTAGNIVDEQFKSYAVGLKLSLGIQAKSFHNHTVSSPIFCCYPFPASGFVINLNAVSKPIQQRLWRSSSSHVQEHSMVTLELNT